MKIDGGTFEDSLLMAARGSGRGHCRLRWDGARSSTDAPSEGRGG
jgi:hypothetical protein